MTARSWVERHPAVMVVAAASCLVFTGILFVVSGTSSSTATVFRCVYALPLPWFLARVENRRLGPRSAASRRWALLAGGFLAVDLLLFHYGITLMGAGLSTVMSNLQVVIVAGVAWALLRERPTVGQLGGVALALAGIVLISGIVGTGAYGREPGLGVAVGMVVATTYAGYLLCLRVGRDSAHIAGPIYDSALSCGVVAAVAGLAVGDLDPIPTWPAHGWLLLLALTAQALGYLLLAVALPRLPALTTSLLLLVQPMLTVLLSMLLIHEAPSAWQLAGVGLVLAGLALGSVPLDRVVQSARRLGTRPA